MKIVKGTISFFLMLLFVDPLFYNGCLPHKKGGIRGYLAESRLHSRF